MRRVSLIAALATCAALLSGCVGDPAPVETTPLFANEDEAFAAAEATYRAYVDALNQVMADAEAEVDPLTFLTGSALEQELDSANELAVTGEVFSGQLVVVSVSKLDFDDQTATVKFKACLDISGTSIHDSAGQDITPPERVPIVPLEVVAQGAGLPPLISNIGGYTGDETC